MLVYCIIYICFKRQILLGLRYLQIDVLIFCFNEVIYQIIVSCVFNGKNIFIEKNGWFKIYVYIYKVLYFLKYEKVVRSYILLLYNCGNKIRLFKLLFI